MQCTSFSSKLLHNRVDIELCFREVLKKAKEMACRYGIPEAVLMAGEILFLEEILTHTLTATPNYIHKVITVEAIKASNHAFLEKPIISGVEDDLKIVKMVKGSKCEAHVLTLH